MVKFASIPGLYELKCFTQQNYVVYVEKELAAKVAKQNLAEKLAESQPLLQRILDALISKIEQHPRFKTPIFTLAPPTMSPVSEQFPFTGTLDRLQTLKKTTTILLESRRIKQIITGCISSFQDNEIAYGYENILGTNFERVVSTANQLGRELKEEFAEVIGELTSIENDLTALKRLEEQRETALTAAKPSGVLLQEFNGERQAAIARIRQKADESAKRGDTEASGVRRLCDELNAERYRNILAADLGVIYGEYATLRNMKKEGGAAHQVAQLRDILEVNQKNIDSISAESFDEETLRPFCEQAIVAPGPGCAVPAAQVAVAVMVPGDSGPGPVDDIKHSGEQVVAAAASVHSIAFPIPTDPKTLFPSIPSHTIEISDVFEKTQINDVQSKAVRFALFNLLPFTIKSAVPPHLFAALPHIEAFIKEVKELTGTVPDADLVDAVEHVHALLSNPQSTLENYTMAANTMRGHLTHKLTTLSLIMIAIGAAIATALGVGLIPVAAVSVVACVCTMFATKRLTTASQTTIDIGRAIVKPEEDPRLMTQVAS